MTEQLSDPELQELLEAAGKATPGEWMIQDSNSWRRIGTVEPYGDGNVIYPTTQRSDGHPDLHAKREDLDYIALANPERIKKLVLELKELRKHCADLEHDLNAAIQECNEHHSARQA